MHAAFGKFPGTWNDFFHLYEQKHLVQGDPIHHTLGWWKYHTDDNVMFSSYEEMKQDIRSVIRKVAIFLKKDLSEETIEAIVAHTSFDQMKVNPMTNKSTSNLINAEVSPFMRKGQVGDWRNYFSQEQSKAVDQRVKDVEEKFGLKFIFDI